jgi:hypothetical protein
MSKQFVMTLKVPLPDDIFEHATVLTGIKQVMDKLTDALRQDVPNYTIASDVIGSRVKKVGEASSDEGLPVTRRPRSTSPVA